VCVANTFNKFNTYNPYNAFNKKSKVDKDETTCETMVKTMVADAKDAFFAL
jgi:hypothetical protein